MTHILDQFETKYIPLYILMIIFVGTMVYWGIKHLVEAFIEVKNKKKGIKNGKKK